MDTTDSVMMTGTLVGVTTERKRHYNLTVTAISVIAAFMIGNVGSMGSAHEESQWDVAMAESGFGQVGYYLVALLDYWGAAASWHQNT